MPPPKFVSISESGNPKPLYSKALFECKQHTDLEAMAFVENVST